MEEKVREEKKMKMKNNLRDLIQPMLSAIQEDNQILEREVIIKCGEKNYVFDSFNAEGNILLIKEVKNGQETKVRQAK